MKAIHLSQPTLVGSILKAIDKMGVKDVLPRHINAVVDAANLIVAQFGRDCVMAKADMGLAAWRRTDDTGASSFYMASVFTSSGASFDGKRHERNHPHDAGDFGRCVRLLEAVPEFRARVPELMQAEHGKVWNALAAEWDALEALYRQELPKGRMPKLYAKMTAIVDAARKEPA